MTSTSQVGRVLESRPTGRPDEMAQLVDLLAEQLRPALLEAVRPYLTQTRPGDPMTGFLTSGDFDTVDGVLGEIRAERARQHALWGEQNHPDGTGGPVMRSEADAMRARCQYLAVNGGPDWRAILLEEVYEALAEDEPAKLRKELVQVAAVATAWVEAIDRRTEAGRDA